MADEWDAFPVMQSETLQWDAFPAVDSPPADPVADITQQGVLGINRGLNSVIAMPGELLSAGVRAAGFPETAEKLRWNNQVSRAITRPDIQPQTELGRYANAVGQGVGAGAIPSAGILAGASRAYQAGQALAPATTAVGSLARSAGQSIAARPGAAVGADLAAAASGGVAQQAAADAGAGVGGQVVAGLAGGMLPSLAGVAARGIMQPIHRARANQGIDGAYGSVADDLNGDVDTFANQVAAGGSRNMVTTNRRTLDILGEEMARADGDVAAAQQATINRIVTEQGVTPQTAAAQIRRLTQVHEGSDLMFGEYGAVAGSDQAQRLRQPGNVDLNELGRTQNARTQDTLDYLANNGNTQSATNVRNALSQRQEQLSETMRRNIDEIGPQVQDGPRIARPATIQDSDDFINQARRAGQAEYREAYSSPINHRVALVHLPRMMAAFERQALGRSGDARAAMERAINQFYLDTAQGRVQMMDLQQLQDARGVVRGQIDEYMRQGRRDLVRAVQPIYSRVTRMMEAMSPAWARANQRWADMNFLEMGADLGKAFAMRAGPRFREQLREFQRLAPDAQNIVRINFLQQLRDKLDNLGDTHSISKLFTNDHARNMIRTLLGDDAAIQFTRAVRNQRVAETSQRMMQNSATHRRGMAQRQKDAETGLVAAVESANVRGVRNWILERLTQLITERRNRPLADILTTPMSDTARVAQHLHRLRQQQARLLTLQNRPLPSTPVGGLIGAGMPLAAPDRQTDPSVPISVE